MIETAVERCNIAKKKTFRIQKERKKERIILSIYNWHNLQTYQIKSIKRTVRRNLCLINMEELENKNRMLHMLI